jgi:hypothetical protein
MQKTSYAKDKLRKGYNVSKIDFEIDEYEYNDSDDEEDDCIYNTKYGYESSVYMGNKLIRTIYIGYTYGDDDYADENDY